MVFREGIQPKLVATGHRQEMGETYNMMTELLLTAGSSSSAGGSSPDVVVGEIAKAPVPGLLRARSRLLSMATLEVPNRPNLYKAYLRPI